MFEYRSMFDLFGGIALVVGAGSGIGAVSAQGLAAFGARVFRADLNAASVEETVREIRDRDGKGETRASERGRGRRRA